MNEIFVTDAAILLPFTTQKQGFNGSIMYLLLFFFDLCDLNICWYLLEVQFVFRQKIYIPKGKLEYFTWLIADKINNIFHQTRGWDWFKNVFEFDARLRVGKHKKTYFKDDYQIATNSNNINLF